MCNSKIYAGSMLYCKPLSKNGSQDDTGCKEILPFTAGSWSDGNCSLTGIRIVVDWRINDWTPEIQVFSGHGREQSQWYVPRHT